jgi:hypothetical protein
VGALGLTLADLFFDLCTPHGHRPIPKLKKLDLVALAFQFEMGALDRRLRADRILKAAKGFTIEGMQDEEFERLTKAVVRAYSDQERAEFLEMVADDLRVKAYQTTIALNAA